MKQCTLLIMFLLGQFYVLPQSLRQFETVDTIGRDLKELVVKGRTQQIIEDGVSYIPDKKSRKFAVDAVDLLSDMQIPQLVIMPDRTVKTISGNDVKIYIDYVEANESAISGIRTEDVVRVEVLDHPSDIRFHQAEHVVNLIMRKYEWGGYTKLMAMGRMLNNERIYGTLYSRFCYRNWKFDINASGSGTWSSKDEETSHETFRDFDYDDRHFIELTRTTHTDRFRARDDSQAVGFRADYSNGNVSISHDVAFVRNGTPAWTRHSKVGYSDNSLEGSDAVRNEDSQSLATWMTGNYYFSFTSGNSLSVLWSMGRNGYRDNSCYMLGKATPILNLVHGVLYFPQIDISHSVQLGHGNSLNTTVQSFYYINDSRYTGSVDKKNRTSNSATQIQLNYRQGWSFGLSASATLGARYNYMRENGKDYIHRWSPSIQLKTDYSFATYHRLSLSGGWYTSGELSEKTQDIVKRVDELVWNQGNPGLKAKINKWIMLSYTFMPRRNLSLSTYASYSDYRHVPVADYYLIEGYDGIVRGYSDDNYEHSLEYGISASMSLLNKSLSFSALLYGVDQRNRGVVNIANRYLTARVGARWSYRNISVGLMYLSPQKSIFMKNGYKTCMSSTYALDINYSLHDLKLRLRFANWFAQGYIRKTYESMHYRYDGSEWNGPYSRTVSITASYTLPYGKRVNRDNEINAAQVPSSGF